MTRWCVDHPRSGGLALLLGSESFASVVGFAVTIHLARSLGASGFADLEYASAVAAWWLVVVRGGFDAIATREVARHPSLVGPLTDVLIGMRLASAILGFAVVLALAWASGPARVWVVLVSGLVLIPSALASDVGFRASGRFGVLAMAQVARASGLAGGAWWLVARPGHESIAAACLVGAEVVSSTVLIAFHGPIRPRFRRAAWVAIARRGAVAGATRFGRVSLYALDVLALGWWSGPGLGPYAAARRVAFALLALGLVVPSAMAPRIARAWASNPPEGRELVARTIAGLLAVALPATVGLMGTADRWMPRLFGEGYREGGPWLALIAARLPFILVSNVQQAALVACRREDLSFRLILGMVVLGSVLVPTLALSHGPWGAGVAALGVEAAGALAGYWVWGSRRLAPPIPVGHCSPCHVPGLGRTSPARRRTSARSITHSIVRTIAGTLGVAGICWLGTGWPLSVVVFLGMCVYGLAWGGMIRRRRSSLPLRASADLGRVTSS